MQLGPGVYICPMRGSKVSKLYERLCRRTGIDGGESLDFSLYLLFEPTVTRTDGIGHGDPYDVVDRACNVVTVFTGGSTTLCRLIGSMDGFKSADHTEIIYGYSVNNEGIQLGQPDINAQGAAHIATMWDLSQQAWSTEQTSGRITNALTYYYYAWRALHPDQTCLNLAIVLESLFAPHTHGETSHQIAFNVAKFLRGDRAAHAANFDLVKRFYGLRSAIVHGGVPDQDKLWDLVPAVFTMTARILRSALGSKEICDSFNIEAQRRALLQSYLFG